MGRGLFEGCLLVSDIDGTIVYGGEIPQRNVEAVRWFMKEGGLFTLATGRSIEATRQYIDKISANCPAITFNGAVIYDYDKEKAIDEYYLPECAKNYVQPIMERFSNVGVEVHSGRDLYVLNYTPEVEWHLNYEKISAVDATHLFIMQEEWTKVLFATDDNSLMEQLHKYAKTIYTEDCYFLKTADIYYELTCAGVNKGTAVKKLALQLGINAADVFAIGDYYNDTEMLSAAGVSAVASGAPDDMKKNASFISGECKEGAVADFIDHIKNRMRKSESNIIK